MSAWNPLGMRSRRAAMWCWSARLKLRPECVDACYRQFRCFEIGRSNRSSKVRDTGLLSGLSPCERQGHLVEKGAPLIDGLMRSQSAGRQLHGQMPDADYRVFRGQVIGSPAKTLIRW